MKPTIQVMLDLETFGTREYSTIISIGAVMFDPTKVGDDAILHEFYVTVDPESATKKGLRLDASTIMWWMDPKQRAALDEWRNTVHFELDVALDGFSQWLMECLKAAEGGDIPLVGTPEYRDTYEPYEQVTLWGNGPQFDCMLLRQAYEVCQRDMPWKHYNERCFRTMKSLPGAKALQPPHEGLQHNALVDARQQAKWLCNIMYALKIDGGAPMDALIGKPMAAPPVT